MDFNLQGKVALVTGASSGIGIAIAQTLADEGCQVVVHGRDLQRTKKVTDTLIASGAKAVAVTGDFATEDSVKSVAQAAEKAFGHIDILVNNAGAPTDPSEGMDFFEISPAHWQQTYQRNMLSVLTLSTYFAPKMKQSGWGRIIQITSGLAYAPRGVQGDYCASKAALNNFTSNFSKAIANSGVTVNGVSPGMTRTPMLDEWLKEMAQQNGLGADAQKGEEFVLEHVIPLTVARLGAPQDIANAVAFIASPRADYMNGTTLRIDGGGVPTVN
jgi:NAD(P)-dependent dehydrogenase (short-subunit alcohol dehydrogenase family)